MTLRRARRGVALLALLLVAGLSGCGGTAQPEQAPSASPTTRSVAARPSVVMFLGDSYTAGGVESVPEQTYAAYTARRLGWQVIIGGRGGTGYVAPGKVNEPFHVLFERQLAWRPAPDLLIVAGGHNDRNYPLAKTTAAARTLLSRITATWPRTPVVVIGPIWGSGRPPGGILAIRNVLQTISTEMAVPFIDPLAEQWITGSQRAGTGNAAQFIRRDQTHPTPAGHRYLAGRLVSDLQRLGLASPRRAS